MPFADDIDRHGQTLLNLARQSIAHGVDSGEPLPVQAANFPEPLQSDGCCFVTLRRVTELRGCIGHLNPHQPLVCDVAENAFASAFRDRRFAPIEASELTELHISIAVLTPREPIAANSESELLAAIRPGEDGIVLQEGSRQSTFLPSVWQDLPEKTEFIRQLKLKAGLAGDYWSDSLRAFRYRTISVEE